MYIYGHPSDRVQPQIWGNEGDDILNSDYINFFMDAWFGDSGGGAVRLRHRWLAVRRGRAVRASGALGDNARPNIGSRIMREVFDFIVANSEL